ncbi:NAD(+)/NADH kinase [Staphylospora marina]|uniref:NAD(+)/NADH kinase n=1 Tax=Staphylospora marina TaxID=2490858 RepID=UPI000F5BB0C3|nr:NAD(+)/NADH kinase [Staphylospora marina]
MKKRIGIILNLGKPRAIRFARDLLEALEKRRVDVVLEPEAGQALDVPDRCLFVEEFPGRVDLVFVLGGDGTLLGVARRLAAHRIPILGFNVGNLGFLSEAEPDDLESVIDRVLAGDYMIESRLMLKAEVVRDGETLELGNALNDVGIAKGSFGRMITCHVKLDGMKLGSYSGDGLIVSTPTGSTAYSLSCGGPIVYPGIRAILLTPICPHTLTSRPMVLPAEGVLEIRPSAVHREMGVTIDGQAGFPLREGDVVRVSRSPFPALLIKWHDRSFFEVVRRKLQGESVTHAVQEEINESATTYQNPGNHFFHGD